MAADDRERFTAERFTAEQARREVARIRTETPALPEHGQVLAAFSASAAASARFEEAMANYETEYDMVEGVDPKTGERKLYLPSRYRAMQAARERVARKRAIRRELARQGISGVTSI